MYKRCHRLPPGCHCAHWKELCRDPTLTSEKFEKSAPQKRRVSHTRTVVIWGGAERSGFVQDCSGKAVRPYQASCRSKGIYEIEDWWRLYHLYRYCCICCINGYTLLCYAMSHHKLHCKLHQGLISMTWNTPMERRDIFKALHVWHGFEHGNWNNINNINNIEHLWAFCALQFLSAFLGLLWHCWFAAERALADWWTSLDCVWLKVKNGRTLKAKTYMIIVGKASESGVFGKSSVEMSGSHIVRWHKQGSNNVQQSLGVNEHIPIIIPNCSRIE